MQRIYSRRSLLAVAAGLQFIPSEAWPNKYSNEAFWNTEDPANWTAEQIRLLTTDSPWARPVTAVVKMYSPNSPSSGSRGGRGNVYSGHTGRGASSTSSDDMPKFQGTVRWASAKPIMLALKEKLPESLANHYLISVSGIPVISGHEGDTAAGDSFELLKTQTALQVKGKEAVQPGIVQQDSDDTSTLYFGFLNQFVDLSGAKEVTFSTTMGPMSVKARFDLKKMIYRGELAV